MQFSVTPAQQTLPHTAVWVPTLFPGHPGNYYMIFKALTVHPHMPLSSLPKAQESDRLFNPHKQMGLEPLTFCICTSPVIECLNACWPEGPHWSTPQQVLPDYLKGLFSSVPACRPSEQQLQQVSKLASLQHRAKDHFYLPSV